MKKWFDFLVQTDVSETTSLRLLLTLHGKPHERHDEDIIFLVQLYKAVALGERKGLEMLAGPDAVLGKHRRCQLEEFGKKRGKEQTNIRQIAWRTWNDEAIRLRQENPWLTKMAESGRS